MLQTYIFVDSSARHVRTWDGGEFVEAIRSVLPRKYRFLDDILFSDLFTSIVQNQLQPLVPLIAQKTRSTSLLNRQGGHNDNTSNYHYGLDNDGHHSAFQMSRIAVERCWTVCEVWQAFWELETLDERWFNALHSSFLFLSRAKLILAREVVRKQVLLYCLDCADQSSIVARIASILHHHPFFLPKVCIFLKTCWLF